MGIYGRGGILKTGAEMKTMRSEGKESFPERKKNEFALRQAVRIIESGDGFIDRLRISPEYKFYRDKGHFESESSSTTLAKTFGAEISKRYDIEDEIEQATLLALLAQADALLMDQETEAEPDDYREAA